MAVWQLRTLGSAALLGPDQVVPLDDAMLAAFLAALAVAGGSGMSSDELQLLLTPDAKRATARQEIARLVGRVRELIAENAIDVQAGERYALGVGALSLDVDVLPQESATECAEFLRGVRLSNSPEFTEWLAATRRRVQPKAIAVDASATVQRQARRPSRRVRVTAIVVVSVVAVGLGVYLTNARPSTGFVTGDAVLVADVANTTGDSIFDQGMQSAASVALQQSGRLRLYARSRLPAVYRLMRIADGN